MALNFPKLPGIGTTDAKSRIFLIFAGIVGIGILIYIAVKFFGSDTPVTGPSKVASAPAGLQSVPGSQLTPEYYQALKQANVQATQQAQISGGSAVPTLVNIGSQQSAFGQGADCGVVCPNDDNVSVESSVNDLVRQGKLTQDEADRLNALSKNNASVSEYAAALDELVRQGKLTPEQARKLLEDYRKQHSNALLKESAASMDGMIKSGQLSTEVANQLLAMQKAKLTPAQYAAELDRLVREGKISPAMAAQLLAQYTQQQQRELAKQGAFDLTQMAKAGQITPDVAKQLAALQKQNIPVDQYAAQLASLVANGKLTPAAAAKLLDAYKQQRVGLAASGTLAQLLNQGGAKADEARRLLALQGNNASLQDYTDELKRAVAAGLISPEMAAQLLKEYQASIMPIAAPGSGVAPTIATNIPGAEDFAKLQQKLQEQVPQQQAPQGVSQEQFAQAQAQAAADAAAARMQRIQDMETAMSAQAQQLISTAWVTPKMVHMAGSADTAKTITKTTATTSTSGSGSDASNANSALSGAPIVKAGTIYFAVLDTAVNSDYPDTPVMATVVQGPYKGAKLLGKVQVGQGPNQEKVALTFNLMSMDAWPTNKNVNAFAIDPDTARTVLASNVDHHYAARYGALMAASFLSGYSSAVTNAGTSTTGIFGTSIQRNELSPASKIAVGLGQIGQNMTSIAQTYTTIPTTVKVNAGVGLGILFMSDVTQ